MFVQIIEGKVSDKDGLHRQLDRWEADLRPGATGYLGTTSGVTDDDRFFVMARFANASSAKANSDRPEQGAWWEETETCFDGPVSFSDSEDVEHLLAGGSNDAGFVQVMKSPRSPDRSVLHDLDAQFEKHASAIRPDLIGGVRIWTPGGGTVEVNYFTSELEARANESSEPPAELAAAFAQFAELMADTEFIDLRDPWLY